MDIFVTNYQSTYASNLVPKKFRSSNVPSVVDLCAGSMVGYHIKVVVVFFLERMSAIDAGGVHNEATHKQMRHRPSNLRIVLSGKGYLICCFHGLLSWFRVGFMRCCSIWVSGFLLDSRNGSGK